ncbi:MAG: hypothetical protein JSR76_02185 [Verrucomicrobia bacterium]|nr:hypothetical protein [Verrucomicrobiota bacterium]
MKWLAAYLREFFSRKYTAVFWGAFDPPTEAHYAIIAAVLAHQKIEDLIIVLNNHNYKNYLYSLEIRQQLLQSKYATENRVRFVWQDDQNEYRYERLQLLTRRPLCAVAGYDAYKQWLKNTDARELHRQYQAIAVVPRGDEVPVILSARTFLLKIDLRYRYISSTMMRAAFVSKTSDSVRIPDSDFNASTK